MNTLQIDRVLQRNYATRNIFIGCFPSDRIPNFIPNIPFCLVVNTDPSNSPGSHWIAIFCESSTKVEYFDSLGIWPSISDEIKNYLSQFPIVRYNKIQIQKPFEKTCGKHAIFFLYMRCLGYSMNKIVSILNSINADKFVTQFIGKQIFNINN